MGLFLISHFHSLDFLTRRFGNDVSASVSAVSPPVCAAPALASGVSLPADLTGVSIEPVKASSAECPVDDLDVTLGALARQLVSSSAVVPHGGEGYPPS